MSTGKGLLIGVGHTGAGRGLEEAGTGVTVSAFPEEHFADLVDQPPSKRMYPDVGCP